MTGMEFLTHVRFAGHLPPVMFITAFGGAVFRDAAGEAGAAAVLDKPFEMSEFRAMVRRLVDAGKGPSAGDQGEGGGMS